MITLIIDGKHQRYGGDPDMPLLWVLRDELNRFRDERQISAGAEPALGPSIHDPVPANSIHQFANDSTLSR